MSDTGLLIWLIATAVMVIVVLTVGTLAAAGLLRSKDNEEGHR